MGINTLSIAHQFVREHVRPGAFCIDATAGRGRDTLFLCELAGPTGTVLALDIQEAAVESTRALLSANGQDARVILDSHSHLSAYADPGTVDCILFNFGWLPGGDHAVFTRPETSIPAIRSGLELLKPGGIMSLCIYYGGASGYYEERDALLAYLKTVDPDVFTVLTLQFHNRPNDPPIPVMILKQL